MTDIITALLLPPLWRIVGEYMSAPERTMVSVAISDLGAPKALELHALVRDGHLNVLQWLAVLPAAPPDMMPRILTPGTEPVAPRGIIFREHWWDPANLLRPVMFTKTILAPPLDYVRRFTGWPSIPSIPCGTVQQSLVFCAALCDRVEIVNWLSTILSPGPPRKSDAWGSRGCCLSEVVRHAGVDTLEALRRRYGWDFRSEFTEVLSERKQGALPVLRWLMKAGGRVDTTYLHPAADPELAAWLWRGSDVNRVIDGPHALRKFEKKQQPKKA